MQWPSPGQLPAGVLVKDVGTVDRALLVDKLFPLCEPSTGRRGEAEGPEGESLSNEVSECVATAEESMCTEEDGREGLDEGGLARTLGLDEFGDTLEFPTPDPGAMLFCGSEALHERLGCVDDF